MEVIGMCGRYYVEENDTEEEMLAILETLNRRSITYKTGEIFPTDFAPVVAPNKAQQPTSFAMTWGYTMPDGKRFINARSETAASKPLFRDGMLHRRCLVPANHYFEWERRGKDKTKYAIRPAAKGMMYMAGIYRLESSGASYTILTREPADSIRFIHNRMPVILTPDMAKEWLHLKTPAEEILRRAVTDVTFCTAQ